MSLNPIKWIVGAAGDAFGTWQERKAQAKKIEGEIAGKRLEYKKAKFDAKINRLTARGRRDMSYDMQVLKNRQHTWLDEFIGVAIVGITLCAFLPWTAPYVKEGWQSVSEAPFWFQFAWIVLISSTLGGLTILRIMMGSKVGNGIRDKIRGELTNGEDEKKERSSVSSTKKAEPEESSPANEGEPDEEDEDGYPFKHRHRR